MSDEPGQGGELRLNKRLAEEIRRFRTAAGLSQPKLAQKIGYSRQYISQAENQQRGLPSAELVQAIDRGVSAGGALIALRKEAQLEAYALRHHLLGLEGAAPHATTGYVVTQEDDDMKRRTLLGAALASPLVSRLEELRQGLNGVIRVEPTERDADDWEQVAQGYANDVGTIPAVRLIGDLITDFAEIRERIEESSGRVRIRLVHSGAQLAALTAITLINMDEPRSAERWWRTATRAVEQVKNMELAALIYGRHAVFSLYGSPPSRVFALADSATESGRATPCVGVISGLAARAQTLAEMGRRDEAAGALHDVIDMFERLPASVTQDQRSQWSWSEQRLRHVESYVHAQAGHLTEAVDAQAAALACYPAGNYQGRTQVDLYGATALIRSGDVRSGVDQVVRTLEKIPDWQRRDGLVQRSALATLDSVPRSRRAQPGVQAAREFVSNLNHE